VGARRVGKGFSLKAVGTKTGTRLGFSPQAIGIKAGSKLSLGLGRVPNFFPLGMVSFLIYVYLILSLYDRQSALSRT